MKLRVPTFATVPPRRRRLRCLVVALAAWGAAAGCGSRPARTAKPEPLAVAAASDLQAAFPEIGALFERETGQPVRFAFASTGTLTQQIEHGAPFDVFAAANEDFIRRLEAGGHVLSDTVAPYARGHIVLAWRKGAARLESLEDLRDPAIHFVAIANPAHAPYGRAARQALEHASLWDPLQPKITLAENIRQATVMIEMGNAEAGIVARSVVAASGVEWTEVDASLYDPIEQTVAVVAGSPQSDAARRFVQLLLGEAGQRVLARSGFSPPGKGP